MSNKLLEAIDVALETLKLNKLCRAQEDGEAYYFLGCGDNGEPLTSESSVRVDKATLKCEPCYHDDKRWNTPKKAVEIPEKRRDAFARRWISFGDNEIMYIDNDEQR